MLVSAFVSLTLTPMMCSRLLKTHEEHGKIYNITESFRRFDKILSIYTLQMDFKNKWLAIVIMGLSVFICSILAKMLKSELANGRQGRIIVSATNSLKVHHSIYE